MANPFDQFDGAATGANAFDQFDKTPQKGPGFARKAGDLAAGFVSGALGATKALTDVAGAGNGASNFLDAATKDVDGLLSPQAQADRQEQSAIMQGAEGKGVYEGIKAGAKAFGLAPLQTAIGGLGSVVPTVAATMATGGGAVPALLAGAATGMAMGAGTIKGAIYDDVKKRSLESGMTPDAAEAAAQQAQAYGGGNTDQIALGAGLGALDSATGVTPIIGNMARKAIGKEVVKQVAQPSARGFMGRIGMGALGEFPLEAAQGGQEQLATNIGAQRAGFQAGTWDNVASNATLEGLASAGPGAVFGAINKEGAAVPPPAVPPAAPPDAPTPQLGFNPMAGTHTIFPDGSIVLNSESSNGAAIVRARKEAERQDNITNPFFDNGLPPEGPRPDPVRAAVQSAADAGGALSAAAVVSMDTGANLTAAVVPGQTAESDGVANGGASQIPSNVNPATGEIASAYAVRQADAPKIEPGDVLNLEGRPFPSNATAKRAAQEAGEGARVIRLGSNQYVVRKTGAINDGNTGDVRGLDSTAAGGRGNQPGAGVGAGMGDSGAAGPAMDPGRAGAGDVGGSVSPVARGIDAGRADAVAPSLTGFKLDGQGNPLVQEARNRSLTGQTATDFMGRPADPLQGAQNATASQASQPGKSTGLPAAGAAAVQADGVKKLPATDIRMGDTVRKDGVDYVVSGGIDGGISATRTVSSQDGVTQDETIFLKGDDAIAARIAAQNETKGTTAHVPQPAQAGAQASPAPGAQAAPASAGNQAALDRIAAGKAWFGSGPKAQEFIAKNGLKDTHKAARSDDGKRWDVVATKPVAETQAATPGETEKDVAPIASQDAGALSPALSAKLQEAHKALGRDVTRKQVRAMRDRIANEAETGQTNNGGMVATLTPLAIKQRQAQLTRLDADLALFDEAKTNQPEGTTREPQADQAQQAEAKRPQEPAATPGVSTPVRAEPRFNDGNQIKRASDIRAAIDVAMDANKLLVQQANPDTNDAANFKRVVGEAFDKALASLESDMPQADFLQFQNRAKLPGYLDRLAEKFIARHYPKGEAVPAQAASTAAAPATAESSEQRAKRIAEAGAAWTRMPSAERQSLIGRLTGLKPVIQKNLHTAVWGNLNGDIQRRLADAMAPATSKADAEVAPGAPLQDAMSAAGWNAEVSGAGNTIWIKRVNKDRYTAILTPETNSMEVTVLVDAVDTQIASFKVAGPKAAADAASKAVADDTAESAAAPPGGTVNVPAEVDAALTADMQKQKSRIQRLRTASEAGGLDLEGKKAAQLKVTAAEATLRAMRTRRFDAEDAAVKAVDKKDIAAFGEFADLFPAAAEAIQALIPELSPLTTARNMLLDLQAKQASNGMIGDDRLETQINQIKREIKALEKAEGQNDELDAEMQAYEAGLTAQTRADDKRKLAPTAKPDTLTEREKAAKAKMLGALGKLAALASKNTRMNWTPEEEQKLLPIVIELFDGAIELGAVTFQKAVAYVRDFIAQGIDQETADAIPFETLQGAYIAVAGRHKDKPVTAKRDVAGFDSLEELQGVVEPESPTIADTEQKSDTDKKDAQNANPDTTPEPGQQPAIAAGAGVQGSIPRKVRGNAGGVRGGDTQSTSGDVGRGSNENSGTDYVPASQGLTRTGSWFETAKRNIDLIELAIKIDTEKRPATPQEQEQLAKYVGFGASAIRNDLFPIPPDYAKRQDPNRLIWPNMVRDAKWKPLAERIEALPREWQQSILQSSQYAHYTSEGIIRSVWGALERMGFKGGNVFEPGMGIGSFAMLMPNAVRDESRYTGIEFDGPTALIAGLLSPKQNMIHGDFIKRKFPKNFFDVNVGNPPFSQTKIYGDPDYAKNGFMLHDFFFAKGIDLVRPGGLQVFVTSKGTMDKQSDKARKYLSERADLLGAIRLPSTAFEGNAGTSVVTDVIFLKKRAPGEAPAGHAWGNLATVETPDGPVVVNEYFAANPNMVLGQQRISGNVDDEGRRINSNGRGGEKYTVVSYDKTPTELDIKFAEAIKKLPAGAYAPPTESQAKAKPKAVDFDPAVKREGVIYLGKDGALMRVDEGIGKSLSGMVNLSEKEQAWVKSYVSLRDKVQSARFDQLNDGPWEKSLAALNKAYDAFRKEHGPIKDFRVMVRKSTDEDGKIIGTESRIFKNRKLYREDYDSALITSLEEITEDGDIVKAPFLMGRTIGKPVERVVRSIGDALAVSLDEVGSLIIEDVGRRLDLSHDETIEALGAQVYQTPSGEWKLADEYLSGDVVSKLEEAEQAARLQPELRRNIQALKDVQPEKLGPSQISAKLGASWIPESHVNEFAGEIGAGAVTFDPRTETWQVDGGNLRSQRNAGAEYGTAARSPSELLEAVLNSRSIKVTQTVDKKVVTDETATTAANEMAKKIKDKFKGWVWTDTDRSTELVESYNKLFNNIAPRRFDGSHLTLPGVSLRFKLHPHQLRAIWRMVQTGNTYLAHAVGAGKTIEMIAGGMEQKRLGLIKKPVYVVPNHMLEQFSNEFMELYPMANIMVADDENFSPERRKAFVAAATLNNPDAIVITHDAFQRIGVKEESVAPIRDEILADLEIELSETAKSNETRVRRGQLEQQIEAVKQRFDRIIGAGAKDSTVKFEDMGVDFVFADEAHVFRKLDFHTAQQIKGIDPNGSKRALDMYVKTRILEGRSPGRSMVFASGTPVTNTMGELYTIMRFFGSKELDKGGISTFDAWARQFGEVAPALEPNAAGKYELVERFAKFDNVPELMSRVRQFMDVLTSDNLGALVKRPDIKGGKPNLNITAPNKALQAYMKGELASRIEASRKWKPSKDEPNNPDPIVAIITDGRFAALDPRFFGGKLEEGETSLLMDMGKGVVTSYHATKDNVYKDKAANDEPIKGSTQLVFYNLGFGEQSQKNRGFNSRAAFTKILTDGGIPRSEIYWFDDANTDAKKEAVFKDVRNGKVKVLIGSAKKMGTGVNVQKRLAVLHYQDPPWFPADVEQPHGRIIRQGNQNAEGAIEWYTTKGTYQSTMWQMVARKQRFIDQAFTGDKNLRSMDDMGEASLFEQAAAVASGDPRAIQLAGLRQDVQRFERLQASHASEQINVASSLRSAQWGMDNAKKRIASYAKAFSAIGERYFSFSGGKVGSLTYTKPGEFGQAIKDAFNKEASDAVMAEKPVEDKAIANIGEAITIYMDQVVDRNGVAQPEFDLSVSFGGMTLGMGTAAGMGADVDAAGLARRIFNQINSVDQDLRKAKDDLVRNEVDANKLRKKLGAPFEYQQEMAEKYAELKRLEAELQAEGAESPATKQPTIKTDDSLLPPATRGEINIRNTGAPEANTTDVVFSRSKKAFSPRDQAKATEAVERLANGIAARWENGPKIVVAFDMQDARIPERVRQEDMKQRSGGAAGTPEGFYYKGTVYLMSSMLPSPTDTARVLFHEALGHHGLRNAFGSGLKPILQQIATMRRAQVDAKMLEYGLRGVDSLDRLTAAEEVLAEMAQATPEIGFVQRAIAAIRTWVRANVPGFSALKLTDAEIIRSFILPARRFVEGGPGGGPRGGVSFSRSAQSGNGTRFTRPWYDRLASQLPASYREDPHRREPLPAEGGDVQRASEVQSKVDALNKELRGPRDTKGYGPVSVDPLGNLQADARVAGIGDVVSAIKDLADEIGYGVVVTGVRADHIQILRGAGFESEISLAAIADRLMGETPEIPQLITGVKDSGTIMSYKPRGLPMALFSRAKVDDVAARLGDAVKNITITDLKQRAGFKATDYLGMGLQTLGRRQLVDLYGDSLPLDQYSQLVAQMEADKNEVGAEADKLASDWGKLDDERQLAELMHDATLAQIDPDKPLDPNDNEQVYRALKDRFTGISDGAREVYRGARKAYQNHHEGVRQAIKDRIERSDLKGEKKADLLRQMDNEFFSAIKGVYFPLSRFGQYVVITRAPDGMVHNVSRAETMAEADELRRNMLRAFPAANGYSVGKVILNKEFIASSDTVGRGFMTKLYDVLGKQDMDEAQRTELEDTLGQLYLSSLPDLSWAKHGIHRKGTPGFSQDARRAFAQNMFHGARYLAKLRYSDLMQDELASMQSHIDTTVNVLPEEDGFNGPRLQRVVNEFQKRHESLMNPDSSPLSTALTSFGFVFHLGLSPASALVNLSQTAMVAYPIMGAKWGYDKAASALMAASKQAAKGKNDIRASLNEDEKRAFDAAVKAGVIDVTMAHDLAGIAQGEDSGVMWKIRPVMRWASFLFHHAEKFNRQVTFIAAYRLARESNADHQAAFEQATKATYDGHFDYSAANRPRIMQGNVAKVLLLFKQYGQNMVYTLARQAYLAAKAGSPAQRKEARKALGGLLVSHAMGAGVLGLPLVSTLLAAASMAGGDDDEPWDAKVALQNMLADALGQKPTEVLMHGLSRLTPWDISGRVGLDRLILPDVQEGLEGQRLAESAMTAALGPVAGIAVNVLKGAQEISQGHTGRGIESMMPAALRSPIKALRYANEGAQDKTGVSIVDEVNPAASLGQALGFSPSAVRNATEGKSAIMDLERALNERRAALVRQHTMAVSAGDQEGAAEVRDAIRRFNEVNPSRRITMPNLAQGVRAHSRRVAQSDQGVYLPRKHADAREAGAFALTE